VDQIVLSSDGLLGQVMITRAKNLESYHKTKRNEHKV